MADWTREIGAITLYVPDLGEARKFYADAFGLDAQPVDDDTAMLRFGSIFVFLGRSPRRRSRCRRSLSRPGRARGSSRSSSMTWTRCARRSPGRGVQPLTGPADRDWGMRTATFADPGGHIWEIAQELPSADG